jgi:hypothetical protein
LVRQDDFVCPIHAQHEWGFSLPPFPVSVYRSLVDLCPRPTCPQTDSNPVRLALSKIDNLCQSR